MYGMPAAEVIARSGAPNVRELCCEHDAVNTATVVG